MQYEKTFGLVTVSILAAFLMGLGCPTDSGEPSDGNNGTNGDNTKPVTTPQLFEEVWTDFSKNYALSGANGVDWNALRSQYESLFSGELSAQQFTAQIAAMLATLKDPRIKLVGTDGGVTEVYTQPAEPNYIDAYDDDFKAKYFEGGVLTQSPTYPLRHAWIPVSGSDRRVAYVAIDSFDGWTGVQEGDINALFQEYADAVGMIVDIRKNTGGDEAVARMFASHFTTKEVTYGWTRSRVSGDDPNAFGDYVPRTWKPAATARFLKPVRVLIGQRNMGAAEWFILMMLTTGRTDIEAMGDRTAGIAGDTSLFSLPNGMKVYIPTSIAYRADGLTKVDGNPIVPSDQLPPDETIQSNTDRLIDRAFGVLTR